MIQVFPPLPLRVQHAFHAGRRLQQCPHFVQSGAVVHVDVGDLVVRHRDKLRAWVPDTVESRKLEALCEQRRKLVNQRVALTNRLTSLLKQYFPQALEWVGDVASGQACDFLTQWPTLGGVQRARPSTIRQFYRAHNCRKTDVIEARLAAIASAMLPSVP